VVFVSEQGKQMKKKIQQIKSKKKRILKRQQKSKAKKKQQSYIKQQMQTDRAVLMVKSIYNTIHHFYPTLFDKLELLLDIRQLSDYTIAEIVFACIAMYIFKEGSRNSFNNDRSEDKFRKNYFNVFGLRLPHMDTVNNVIKHLPEDCLEKLKTELVKELIEKKVFKKFNLLGKYYCVAIDGTGVMQVPEGHCDHCLSKTYKSGKIIYFHNVLEAKLVTSNGFSISIGTEWIENLEEYDKQDCELKAFKRLSEKIKKYFCRLPICILADGLYPNQSFFKICNENNWRYIVTFKDGNLPSVWEEVEMELLTSKNERKFIEGKEMQSVQWLNDLPYHKYNLHWVSCVAETGGLQVRFVYLTDISPDYHTVKEIVDGGRMRSRIEDSFNTQKNRGYKLSHKYSRKSYLATKNYYQCMQIGHLINQLLELGSLMKPMLKGKITLKHLWKLLISCMTFVEIDVEKVLRLPKFQVRFE